MSLKRQFKLTQLGNAERFENQHGDEVMYCYAWKKWLIWDGRRWCVDESGEVDRRAKQTVRSIAGEIKATATDDVKSAYAAFARRSESKYGIDAMVNLPAPRATLESRRATSTKIRGC